MNKEKRLIKAMQPTKDIAGAEMILPNTSGDHVKGIKRQTPTADIDLVNKEYVDDKHWLSDKDKDTFINCELTADQDVLHFYTAGTEKLNIGSTYASFIGVQITTDVMNATSYRCGGTEVIDSNKNFKNILNCGVTGKITSTIADGNMPMEFTSTTLCTNLNADLWDGYQFSDYLDQAVKTTSNVSFGTIGCGTVTTTGINCNGVLDFNFSGDNENLKFTGASSFGGGYTGAATWVLNDAEAAFMPWYIESSGIYLNSITGNPVTMTGALNLNNPGTLVVGGVTTIDASRNLTNIGAVEATSYKVGGAAGVSGTFTTTDGKTVTVTNGIITSIV